MALTDFTFNTSNAQKPKNRPLDADLNHLNQEDLLNLRAQIDAKLTGIKLNDLDLVQETMFQLKKAKILQSQVNEDEETPANQKAQIQNSLNNIITNLSKHQINLYTSERMKRMEGALIRVLKTLTKAEQTAFMESYGQELANET